VDRYARPMVRPMAGSATIRVKSMIPPSCD
jgi:hypothetical protein